MTRHAANKTCKTTHRVTYRMTDQMGVVYYGNYMELFEVGRNEYMRDHGLNYLDMEADGYLLPCTRVECDYLQPARFDDLLEIHTTVMAMTRVKLHFKYEIRRAADSALLTRGISHHVWIARDGRLRRLTPEWMGRLSALLLEEATNGREEKS